MMSGMHRNTLLVATVCLRTNDSGVNMRTHHSKHGTYQGFSLGLGHALHFCEDFFKGR
jgi:hypothetical protein